ncbi:MAG: 3-hydroxyacyl-[acyl-carrier-protein] dehydratase FabZ, partial [SAR324 cluster bacterium]|nr:3-hydroxyacyl-[acyl-carrier-protein] dehydratase FabZ [SAR324 cluster bacterium]
MKDLEAIKGILPHRYPFLMIDRVLEVEAGTYCKALKNITANEEVFQGH